MECISLEFDGINQQIIAKKNNFLQTKVSRYYSDIYQYQLFTENQTEVISSQGFGLGRAIIGGALAGPVGAVLGGLTKTNIENNNYIKCVVAISFVVGEPISVIVSYDQAMEYMKELDYAYFKTHEKENNSIDDLQKQIANLKENLSTKEEPIFINSAANADSLLKRAFEFLKESEWKKANAYGDSVLDIDIENAEAYLVKLLAEFHVNTPEDMVCQITDYDKHILYKKMQTFANPELIQKLNLYKEKKLFMLLMRRGKKSLKKLEYPKKVP